MLRFLLHCLLCVVAAMNGQAPPCSYQADDE